MFGTWSYVRSSNNSLCEPNRSLNAFRVRSVCSISVESPGEFHSFAILSVSDVFGSSTKTVTLTPLLTAFSIASSCSLAARFKVIPTIPIVLRASARKSVKGLAFCSSPRVYASRVPMVTSFVIVTSFIVVVALSFFMLTKNRIAALSRM